MALELASPEVVEIRSGPGWEIAVRAEVVIGPVG